MNCHPLSLSNSSMGEVNHNDSTAMGSMNNTGDDILWPDHTISVHELSVLRFKHYLYAVIIPVICAVGLVGNILNLLVLTRKRLQSSMDRMERSAHVGLMALAISDMLFCIVVLPKAWIPEEGYSYSSAGFDLYYTAFSGAVINVFILTSTWLTVSMAASRYFAICHPLRAREIIGMTFTKASIVCVFIVCIIFNLPRFWHRKIDSIPCTGGWTAYFLDSGYIPKQKTFYTVYMWIFFTIGIFIPLLVLAYCNICLIRALQASTRMRRQYRVQGQPSESTHRITMTLIIIVIMYILLVTPAETMGFLRDMVIDKPDITDAYNLVISILNTLQAFNFSFNFVLYCILNVHFRKTVKDMLCFCLRCCIKDKTKRQNTGTFRLTSRYVTTSQSYLNSDV